MDECGRNLGIGCHLLEGPLCLFFPTFPPPFHHTSYIGNYSRKMMKRTDDVIFAGLPCYLKR